MKNQILIIAALLTLVSCNDDYGHSNAVNEAEVMTPQRVDSIREAALHAAVDNFHNPEKEVTFIAENSEEVAIFEEAYREFRFEIHEREWKKVSNERSIELREDGFKTGEAVYKSYGMTTRETYLRDSDIQDLPETEQKIFMTGFDEGFHSARDAETLIERVHAFEDAQR